MMIIQLKRKQRGNIWMYMQSNLKQSQNQAEKLKKLSDVKCKVNFRPSQLEPFINRNVSNQFVTIFNTKIFILNRKNWPTVHFILSTVVGMNFVKKTSIVNT